MHEGRFILGHKETASDGPLETRLAGSHPLPRRDRLTARQVAQHRTGLTSRAMSANDIAACFVGTFLGLVAAALLIAVLG
jgi:hypothetical protein